MDENSAPTPQTEPTEQETVIGALKDLTKAVSDVGKRMKDLEEEWQKWRRAGKF